MTIEKGAMTIEKAGNDLLSLRGTPSPVIARSGNDKAISKLNPKLKALNSEQIPI
jgi:hypothetical protein